MQSNVPGASELLVSECIRLRKVHGCKGPDQLKMKVLLNQCTIGVQTVGIGATTSDGLLWTALICIPEMCSIENKQL